VCRSILPTNSPLAPHWQPNPGVDLVEPDRIRHIDISAPNDPRYAEQWSLTAIRAQQAWQWFPGRYVDSTLNPDRVRVAVLDHRRRLHASRFRQFRQFLDETWSTAGN
jgi:hypothetical protein